MTAFRFKFVICRYVWLPLWVLPAERGEGLEGSSRKKSEAEGTDSHEADTPADVVVRWHDMWRFSDFDREPNPKRDLGRVLHM